MARTNVRGGQITDGTVKLDAPNQDVTGVLPVANGGTGSSTIPLNAILVGNGTGAFQVILPGANGTVLTSDGSAWSAQAASGGSSSAVPLSIASPDTYSVAANTQVPFMDDIDISGILDLSGNFIEVD